MRAVPDAEKASVRNRLVPILAASPPQIRAQLVATLQKILHYDFPDQWPDFLNLTISLLNAQDAGSVFAGLQCLLAICRVYRFKMGETRGDFEKIVEMTFPQLLAIGNNLVGETSLEAGEMLRTVLKAYKHAIYVSLAEKEHDYKNNWLILDRCCSLNSPRISDRSRSWLAGVPFS